MRIAKKKKRKKEQHSKIIFQKTNLPIDDDGSNFSLICEQVEHVEKSFGKV